MTSSDRLIFPDALRGFTIVMVVAIHARAYATLSEGVEAIVFPIVATVAVPSFFLCDGFLFTFRGGATRFDYRAYVGRSALRLLVPWALFSLAYAAVRIGFEWAGQLDPLLIDQGPIGIAREIYASEVAPQMYFLVSLFLIRLATPAVRPLATAPLLVACSVFLVYAVVYRTILSAPLSSALSYGFDPILHAAWGAQFYLLGAALGRGAESLRPHARAAALLFGSLLVLALVFGARASGYPFAVQYAYLLALFFACWAVEPKLGLVAQLGRESMGIYLLHTPVLLRGLALAATPLVGSAEALYVTIIAAAVAISWGLTRWLMALSWGRALFGVFPVRG